MKHRLDADRRAALGQFLTPAPVARFMASLFSTTPATVRLLDAGAGAGALTTAAVTALCARPDPPRAIRVTAFEIDPAMVASIEEALAACAALCRSRGVAFSSVLRREDFIAAFESAPRPTWNAAILNPPYKKLRADSEHRRLLRLAGIETGNLYTAFLALAARLLVPGGQLVAITPRSFCSGPYFKPFRDDFLSRVTLRRVHVFDARDAVFGDDGVLQENVVTHAIKGPAPRAATVAVSSSSGPCDDVPVAREVPLSQVIRADDPDRLIHIVPDAAGDRVTGAMARLRCSLDDLGVEVSTGRVVEFRARASLRENPGTGCAPLVYPGHFAGGFVEWPKRIGRKPNAIIVTPATERLLLPAGDYTLVKRFSSKEEPRRVVAAVWDAARAPASPIGFENHLNVFHRQGRGLPPALARGIALFLDSTLVDAWFRQWSGHTQVNAADLRRLRYPSLEQLVSLGERVRDRFPTQSTIDCVVEAVLCQPPSPL